MAETTVKGYFEGLSDKLNAKPEKVAGMNCVYQFRVADAAWNVKLTEGKAAVAEGEAPSANCTIAMAEADFLDLVSGKLNGQMAFLTGKLKVAGDMGLALKLGSCIGEPEFPCARAGATRSGRRPASWPSVETPSP